MYRPVGRPGLAGELHPPEFGSGPMPLGACLLQFTVRSGAAKPARAPMGPSPIENAADGRGGGYRGSRRPGKRPMVHKTHRASAASGPVADRPIRETRVADDAVGPVRVNVGASVSPIPPSLQQDDVVFYKLDGGVGLNF